MKQRKHSERIKKNQSTSVKILSVFSVLAIALVFFMLICNLIASNHFDVIGDQQTELIERTRNFEQASMYLTQEIRTYAATSDREYAENYRREAETDKRRENAIEAMRAIGISATEEEMIAESMSISNELMQLETKAMDFARRGKNAEAIQLVYSKDYKEKEAQIQALSTELTETITTRTDERLDRLGNLIDSTFYLTFVCLCLVIVVQFLLIYYVMKEIMAPIIKVKGTMREMAQGNMHSELDLAADSTEIGQLVEALTDTRQRTGMIVKDMGNIMGELADGNFQVDFHHTEQYVGDYRPILDAMQGMRDRQNETLLKIGEVAEEVAQNSREVESASQTSAQGATEQASSIAELSELVGDIAKKTTTNAKNIENATGMVQTAGSEMAEGNQKMSEMVLAMEEISAKSTQIFNIIKTIDDIAFQTNILALNAAIEAARAGSAGKGFAVVADEVRNLAGKSAEAAKNTAELIESSLDSVKKGTLLAGETAQKFQAMVENTEKVVEVIQKIEQASTEQTRDTHQITSGISQISAVIQSNSATAEETAAASVELSGQANALQTLVGGFHLMEKEENY